MPELSGLNKVSRLRIYVSENDRWRGKPLFAAVLEELRNKGIAGASVFRGVAGFGAHSHIHTASIEVLSIDLPVVIETIDTPEKITAVLETLYPMVSEGLITRDEVQVIKYTHRYLNPLPADLLVSEVMTPDVISFPLKTPVYEAWKLMVKKQIKAVPVVNDQKKVVGILTDEDLLERAGIQARLSVAIRLNPEKINLELAELEKTSLTVGGLMTEPAVTVQSSDTLGTATTKMIRNGLKRLPVIDADGNLVGMLSRLDILRQVVKSPHSPHPARLPAGVLRTVQDVMIKNLPVVDQNADLRGIIEKFTQNDLTHLIVVDETGQAIGLISDSDVVARIQPEKQTGILAALRKLGTPPAGHETAYDLMSRGVLTTLPATSVVEAAKIMLENSRKWLVVVDEKNLPLGLVDRQVLLESLTSVYRKK